MFGNTRRVRLRELQRAEVKINRARENVQFLIQDYNELLFRYKQQNPFMFTEEQQPQTTTPQPQPETLPPAPTIPSLAVSQPPVLAPPHIEPIPSEQPKGKKKKKGAPEEFDITI